ncbi:hypothetical protein RHRU231_230005 [Rhodococcus ruber]|uniref:Uncharacterized protein n=1 Tax=Rhodococcus ruber TaxID=1830 RepID=A0A098BG57_9NOCA|nr:hypothetical protein RHRU231_230005 [Rhodococcus ruber]
MRITLAGYRIDRVWKMLRQRAGVSGKNWPGSWGGPVRCLVGRSVGQAGTVYRGGETKANA